MLATESKCKVKVIHRVVGRTYWLKKNARYVVLVSIVSRHRSHSTRLTHTHTTYHKERMEASLATSTAALSLGSESKKKRQRGDEEGVQQRRGKWSSEEEAFAARLIRDFDAGLLQLENGATLRAFLSKKLNCSAMRISKKFAGEKCLGKQIFLRRSGVDDEQLKQEQELLDKLERAFLSSVSNDVPVVRRDVAVVSRAPSSAEPSSASEDEREMPPKSRKRNDLSKSLPVSLAKLHRPAESDANVVENEQADEFSRQRSAVVVSPTKPIEAPRPPPDVVPFGKAWGDPHSANFVGREARELAEELADAQRRANKHKSSSFADLPKADCIQSPPAALMLELGPTPRRVPHPTIGAYAFSIARGTSNSSLQRMADQEQSINDALDDEDLNIDTPSCFFDDDDVLDDDELVSHWGDLDNAANPNNFLQCCV